MKKLLIILMLIPFLSVGQSKIRNTQITSGSNPNETFLKSDGATNAVWDSVKISSLKIDTTLNLKEYSIYAEGQQLPLSNGGCQISTLVDNGDGTVTLSSGDYHLSANVSGKGSHNYTLTGGTFTMTDQSQNYIVADYNSGSPYIHVITDVTLINETTIVPIYTVFRSGTYLHTQNWDALGIALSNKIHQSIVKTQRYRRESGLSLSEYGTHNLNLSVGRIWTGAVPITLDAIATATDNLFFFRHVAGVWTPNIQSTYNFTQYDNGTELVTLTANRYAVNWVFRGVESQKHLYIVSGTGDYTESQAITATLPAIPIAISSHAVLVAKLIVQKNAATASSIQSAFDTQFGLSAIQSHGDLTGRDVVDSHPAGAITNTPYSTISATTVQGAINELTDEKASISGSVNYIWNGTSPQTGNYNLTGNGVLGGTIQATSAKLTNLSDGYIPYHISDASGLGNSELFYNGGNVGIGYSTGTEITNNKLAVNGGIFSQGAIETNSYILSIGAYTNRITPTSGTSVNINDNLYVYNNATSTFNGTVNSTGYQLNGNNLFNSLSSGAITKWDGTKFVSVPSGTENQVLKMISGVPVFSDEAGGIDESGMTANFIQKWDGSKFVDWINPSHQTIPASTTAVLDVNNGINADITMTGDCYLTLNNVKVGTSGNIYIEKQSTNRRLKIKGYTLSISRNVEWDSTGILITGNNKDDSYTWTYNGLYLIINGNKDYNQVSF